MALRETIMKQIPLNILLDLAPYVLPFNITPFPFPFTHSTWDIGLIFLPLLILLWVLLFFGLWYVS